MQTILSLTGCDRKEGPSHALLAQREMFALKAEHSKKSHLTLQSHMVTNLRLEQSFSLTHLSKVWEVKTSLRCQDPSSLVSC